MAQRLPTHRKLAEDLKLSVQTVSRAYDELIRRGMIAGEIGRGSFVQTQPASRSRPICRSGSAKSSTCRS
jgi:DNA-binding transcriptional regulator YhcF (GntR family)